MSFIDNHSMFVVCRGVDILVWLGLDVGAREIEDTAAKTELPAQSTEVEAETTSKRKKTTFREKKVNYIITEYL